MIKKILCEINENSSCKNVTNPSVEKAFGESYFRRQKRMRHEKQGKCERFTSIILSIRGLKICFINK